MYGLTVVTPPAAEPVSVAEAKAHLRLETADEDALVTALVKAAREHAEDFMGRAFVTRVYDLTLDRFPWSSRAVSVGAGAIVVPRPRLQSVESITYVDESGVTQALSASKYLVDSKSEPGRITPAYGETWPTTREQANAVTVRFTAGYGAAAAVPDAIKTAIKLLVAHWYEHREQVNVGNIVNTMPFAVESLLWSDRMVTF